MKTYYNLWSGFSTTPWPENEPVAPEAQASLDAFLEHARQNVCRGNEDHYRWLMGYFAHLIQKPEEKPLVALVFKGAKGSGKNALIERVGRLLGHHFLVTSNRRYLVGNFNGHLERLLLFVLDEAFWSGDKQAEGILKDLITGTEHVIEQKGRETYTVSNLCRVVIIGNEDWLVPASHDERRFFVLDVGDGRKQDTKFFQDMREGMEAGGYRLLLRFLQEWSLDGFDPNRPPVTTALLEQKHASLAIEHQWWQECLGAGRLVSCDFGEEWPDKVSTAQFREAIRRWAHAHGRKTWLQNEIALGRSIKKAAPIKNAKIKGDNAYAIPSLGECKAAWNKFIGHKEFDIG